MATKTLPNNPAEAVKHLRGDRTQLEFARMVGLSAPLINLMENGNRSLSFRSARRIENACGLRPYMLCEIAARYYGYDDLGGYIRSTS